MKCGAKWHKGFFGHVPVAHAKRAGFLFDYNFGRNIVPKALRAAGAVCEAHIDHFAQNAPDEEWLPIVGERGWIVITKDVMIGKRLN